MFEGFTKTQITTSGATINLVYGGSGPPVLLLHGYPQTHVMWHRVAPRLVEHFTVVAADLRGYGDSSKPSGGAGHINYSKRSMAQDQAEVMQELGFERFAVVGHDRGARVSHRLALDYPERVQRLAVLDIVPTYHIYTHVDRNLASSYYHWFFLIQPYDLPERLIGADPSYYLHKKMSMWLSIDFIAPEALAEYERCFNNPDMIHASCEDYRAATTIDLLHDEVDRQRKLACPLLVLWGEKGTMHRLYRPLEVWRDYATNVQGHAIPTGHFIAEEAPNETIQSLLAFLT
ncbi:MAG: alpha/beta hydrolase [Chloroflexi bacterium AL-W]|nr:alpha/beta hydrolase [Chloroflexi bacterium AL-N1]NOK70057.1 alpha/beta hydrolase [Chloroflexi bacterium AL-N10]NOK77931.1 alpha/beta hydrolase [Chloroflexi bacterium AL-N5]NOK84940.1 alpha/beta hydrolase [Chloroflexi bacterium AL-W]NOK91919.1 alpha/beta hydrolase [Chloroflexi bacterium AL-N15]